MLGKQGKGKLNTGMISTAILAIVLVVVLFQFYATTIPTAQAAGELMNDSNRCAAAGCSWNTTNLNCSFSATVHTVCNRTGSPTVPLGGLFTGTGIVFLIVMSALAILVVRSFLKGKK